jgi:hypothetical protein
MKVKYERERTTPTGFPIIDKGINPTAGRIRYADGICKNEQVVENPIHRDPMVSDMIGQIEDITNNLTQCLVSIEEKLTRDTTAVNNNAEYIPDSAAISDRLYNQQAALSLCLKLADRIYNML